MTNQPVEGLPTPRLSEAARKARTHALLTVLTLVLLSLFLSLKLTEASKFIVDAVRCSNTDESMDAFFDLGEDVDPLDLVDIYDRLGLTVSCGQERD